MFSKKKPIIQIFCISGWLAVPINPDKWSSSVSAKQAQAQVYYPEIQQARGNSKRGTF
jgi:hypothetical protein